jgi:hypothetical protein
MSPHDITAGPKPRSSTGKYVVSVTLLVLVVGGIAWIAQYLPAWRSQDILPPPPPTTKLITFPREIASWHAETKSKEKTNPTEPTDQFTYIEPGTKGHYDFLFQNPSEVDAELVYCATGCDCASVKVCVLSAEEWTAVNKQQVAAPGKDLDYSTPPAWQSLPRDEKSATGNHLPVKAGGHGVLRVEWTAGNAGSVLKVGPILHFQPAGDRDRRAFQQLFVPGRVAAPVQYDRLKLTVGPLTPGKSDTKPFFIWSSTREALDLGVSQISPDPLLSFTIKTLSKEEAANLQRTLIAGGFETRVTCAYQVNVTVHESKDGHFLDQGTFYRKSPFTLDGDPNSLTWGPEIVGKNQGDIRIGGQEDHGRIQFKPSISARAGASKEIYLDAAAKLDLQVPETRHDDQPSFLNVKLTRGDKQAGSDRVSWHVEITIPPNAARGRRFEDRSAIVLQIAGTNRFVRIPLDGHITD